MRCEIEESHHLGAKDFPEEVLFKGRLKDEEGVTRSGVGCRIVNCRERQQPVPMLSGEGEHRTIDRVHKGRGAGAQRHGETRGRWVCSGRWESDHAGPYNRSKDLEFYPKNSGKSLKGFKQEK